ncbi:porin [Azonexus caeni]|jgi:predicted porin|uniref:porin n=1 Tax=Azonexus caeni TaxID=266126 RepID=UPI003A88332F
MQKKIIALAVAGLASTAAFAQSNVQIYGVVDVGYTRYSSSDTSALKSRNALDSGLQSGSRIGFRGTEDLGNGLKASFVLEYGIGVDTGAGLTGPARQSFLALSNSYGTVAAGRQYTPQYGLVSKLDPFGAGTTGDVTYGRGVYGMGAAAVPTTIRLNNLVAYVSPNFSGFNVIAGYTADGLGDEDNTAKGAKSADAKIWAINPNYSNGPLFVGLNYHQVKIDAAGYKDRVWDLGASYDFGVVKLAGVYGQIKNDNVGVVLLGAPGGDNSKAKQWMVGATVPVGAAGNVLVSYSRNKIDSDFAAADGAKASKWALGYTHSLSKRTNLYAVYSKISTNTEAEGSFSVKGGAAIGGGADDYTSGLNLGIRHQF